MGLFWSIEENFEKNSSKERIGIFKKKIWKELDLCATL